MHLVSCVVVFVCLDSAISSSLKSGQFIGQTLQHCCIIYAILTDIIFSYARPLRTGIFGVHKGKIRLRSSTVTFG